MALTARISEKSNTMIEELRLITGKTKIEIIEIALEEYRCHEKMGQYNEAYARMQRDKTSWEEELKDRAELEGTLLDGLGDE